MAHFSEAQLKELETVFGLARQDAKNILPIRDGVVSRGQEIWWRSSKGPKLVIAQEAGGEWDNIRKFPQLYSHAEPQIQPVVYTD